MKNCIIQLLGGGLDIILAQADKDAELTAGEQQVEPSSTKIKLAQKSDFLGNINTLVTTLNEKITGEVKLHSTPKQAKKEDLMTDLLDAVGLNALDFENVDRPDQTSSPSLKK